MSTRQKQSHTDQRRCQRHRRRWCRLARMHPHSPEGTPLNERKVEPLAFYRKLLTDSQQNWATIQKELYAILLILTESQLSSYLISRELTIFTDHKNLAYLISAPEKNRMVKRWIPIHHSPHQWRRQPLR
ncbi:hypothetical protein GEMRC1_003886 [Eukaryota sp. GEM-RC1]